MDNGVVNKKRKRSTNRTRKRKRKPATVEKRVVQLLTGEDVDQPIENAPAATPPALTEPCPPPKQQKDTDTGDSVIVDVSDDSSSSDDDEQGTDEKAEEIDDVPEKSLAPVDTPNINVIVLLEGANLDTVRVPGRTTGLALLNSEDHAHVLRKRKMNASDARPDILHQCLLTLLDSPLNKAGRLRIYIRSAKNVLIDVNPLTRIPRTSRRFYGLMAELLQKYKVRGTSGSEPLLKIIRNPLTAHLPVGTRKVVCTYNCENVIDVREHARKMADMKMGDEDKKGNTVLYVVGAIAHGKIAEDWSEEDICISEYPLSAATVCSRLTYAYECMLGIL